MNNATIESLASLRKVERKRVSLDSADAVSLSQLCEGQLLPLLVTPNHADLDLRAWLMSSRQTIDENRRRHGGILFRGFRISSPQQFQAVAEALCTHLFTEYGDLARQEVSDKIYGSTVYPADKEIRFHNESSHMHQWPLKIIFHCARAAATGGATPILDSRRVAGLLSQKTREKFQLKGIRYVRCFSEGLDVDWRIFFRSSSRMEVEAQCRRANFGFEWRGHDSLQVWKVCPAFRVHPETGEEVFFNQVLIHHPAALEQGVRQSLLRLFGEEHMPRDARYGDGSRIEDSVVEEVINACRESAVSFPWQEGDILLLDNMLTAHSRSPFTGERRILVALGDMVAEPGPFTPTEVIDHD